MPRKTIVAILVLTATLSSTHAWATGDIENRVVTVSTGDKSVTYFSRIYIRDDPSNPGQATQVEVLSPDTWTVPPNSTISRTFEVKCPEGQRVSGFISSFDWPNATCGTVNGRVRVPLGTVRSKLACAKDQRRSYASASLRDGCEIWTCPLNENTTNACSSLINFETCECSDPDPPVIGEDVELGGTEFDVSETVIFIDGFESGDLANWSSATP